MDFTSLANLLKPMSSGLAGALLGPAGAAIAPVLIDRLSKAFGTEATPEAVGEAIASYPDAALPVVAHVEAAIGKTIAEIEAAVIETVNQTAREELKSESWFVKHARPFNIWVIGIVTGGYGVCLVAATASAIFMRDAAALNMLVANAGVLGIALAPSGAVAGVSAWGRTKEKLAGASTASASASAIAQAIKGRK